MTGRADATGAPGADVVRAMDDAHPMAGLWDLVVVGAGPAGSAAALSALRARPGARVLLVDRARFPRDKPCGDGIAPQALDVLAGLGLPGLVDDHLGVHRLHLGLPAGPSVDGVMRRAARVVPRRVLDDRIRSGALAAGAVPMQRTVRRVEVRTDEVLLDGVVRARVVVAADGAQSVLRRALGAPPNRGRDLAVAVRGYAPVRPDLADEQRIVFAGADRPAYAWSFPIGDGRANVGYGEVLRPGEALRRADLLAGVERLVPGAGAAAVDWRGHHLPLSTARPRQPDGRVLLVGDAASLVNPLTGEGIYYAVLSGALAGAAAVGAGDPGARYRAALGRTLGLHLRHTSFAAALARHPRVLRAGVRASTRRPVFDDLVELGLGQGLLTPPLVRGLGAALLTSRRSPWP